MLELDATLKILLYSTLWTFLVLVSLAHLSRSRLSTTGLPFAFVLMYTIMHGGALVHLVPDYDHTQDPYLASLRYSRETVAAGLEASFLAMSGAIFGFVIAGSVRRPWRVRDRPSELVSHTVLRRGALILIGLGATAVLLQAIFARTGVKVPGLQAALTTVRNLFAVGACGLILHEHMVGKKIGALLLAALFVVILPTAFLISTAILADSVSVALAIFCFYLATAASNRSTVLRNLLLFAAASLVAFVFASGYLQLREKLRGVVWSGGTIEQAIDTAIALAQEFEPASVVEHASLAKIDGRLNQNIFIGLAIEQLRIIPETYENGETIFLALFGWIPRFIWTTKPERGGSEFVARHTGLVFSEGTTFGAGPIFEFYVNYSYWGVFFGFIVLGTLVRSFDIAAAQALRSGALARFAQFYLAGTALLDPLADLFFLVTAVVSSLAVGAGLRYAWRRGRVRRGFTGQRRSIYVSTPNA